MFRSTIMKGGNMKEPLNPDKLYRERQCDKCMYWRQFDATCKGCHYMLETNKRKVVIDGECKSFVFKD